jgi:hypothetical protein
LPLINNVEREQLFGGLRALPARAFPALATAALLFACGDMLQVWPLAWVALIPVCFACRGAGVAGAFLLSLSVFGAAAITQGYWLFDVDGVNAPLALGAAAVLPALAFAAIELPSARRCPWFLRPLLVGAMAAGFWALLPLDARMLVPLGGLIDSEVVRVLYPKVGLPLMAGCFTAIAWLAAEMWRRGRDNFKVGWPGIALVGLLGCVAAADWLGTSVSHMPESDNVRTVFVAQGDSAANATETLPPGHRGTVVIWPAQSGNAGALVAQAGEIAERKHLVLVLVVFEPGSVNAWVFAYDRMPKATKRWQGADGEPLHIDGAGSLRVYPSLASNEHWSTPWDIEVYVTDETPVARAQARWWLREQRREALIRGSRQVCVWPGGAAAIDGRGHVVAADFENAPFSARLYSADSIGQAMGKARLTVVEVILRFASPVLALMLLLLTPITFAKARRRARRSAAASIAIEEVQDDETHLSADQRDKITRSFRRPPDQGL